MNAYTQSYLSYTYWYDPYSRRQLKTYPINGSQDVFLYDLGHQLLESRGFRENNGFGDDYMHPVDDYVWLGGRPIAMFRGKAQPDSEVGGFQRAPDGAATTKCGRIGDNGDLYGQDYARCGLYFIVTDHIGKPVVMLDDTKLISGVGEYEPFGTVNRTPVRWQTPHPYSGAATPASVTHSMKELGGMNITMRAHFSMVDTDSVCAAVPRDYLAVTNINNFGLGYGAANFGEVWSIFNELPHEDGGIRTLVVNWAPQAGNCESKTNCSENCSIGDGGFSGVVLREVEYQRYQTGAQPFFTSVRFPGQYWDAETDFYENWHRYYYPFRHGYLTPEPMLQDSKWVRRGAAVGEQSPTYAYAGNNPIAFADPKGLFQTKYLGECRNWVDALALAEKYAGCRSDGTGDLTCRCQAKIASCGGCDVCPLLKQGQGPLAFQNDLETIPQIIRNFGLVDADSDRWSNHVIFDDDLCSNPRFVEILAGLMIHEALHLCGAPSFSPALITDVVDARGCDAAEIENECVGRNDL